MPALDHTMRPEELRSIRADLGLSQEQMSARLLVGLRQYKRYEAGQTPIPPLRAKVARGLRRRK